MSSAARASHKKGTTDMATSKCGFKCMECGHKFRTIAAAEKAAFGADGCPKCGGADIQEADTSEYGKRWPGTMRSVTESQARFDARTASLSTHRITSQPQAEFVTYLTGEAS